MFLKKNKGFTLIEITIIIGLIAILSLMVYPNINNITDKAKTVVSDLNEKTALQASIMGSALNNSTVSVSNLTDISDVGDIQDITVTYTGSNDLYLLVSKDGSTWYTYREHINISRRNSVFAGKELIAVDITSAKDIRKKGMSSTLFNDLTTTDWSNVVSDTDKLSFAYYMEDSTGNNISKSNNESIKITITGNSQTEEITFNSNNNNSGTVSFNNTMAIDKQFLFITENGNVKGAGYNNLGQLGDGTKTNRSYFVKAQNLSDIKQVYAGSSHSMFLKENGDVWATGDGDYGRLATGGTMSHIEPAKSNISNVKDISTNHYHTLFLLDDNTVKSVGSNSYGALGVDSENTYIYEPIDTGLENVKQISAGFYHSVFLLNDGTVKIAGYNSDGQLGMESINKTKTPIDIGLSNVKQVSAGEYSTYFLMEDGSVKAVGKNNYGQLGIDNTVNQDTIIDIGLTNVKQIVTGLYNAFFILEDGSVKVTGNGSVGNLGTGNDNDQYEPIDIGLNNVKQIFSGNNSTIFLLNDGTVLAAGTNNFDKFADEQYGAYLTPTDITSRLK